jgi:N-acetylglucosaminyl-diphospho-decaprenol L-rhamnosyltransferase
MSIFISVVSHGHGKLIQNLDCLSTLAKKHTVVVKINLKDVELVKYLEMNNIVCIDELYGIGFGHNNNIVYTYCKVHLSMKNDDLFFIFNPDVVTGLDVIDDLHDLMLKNNTQLAGVNLFKDDQYLIPDNSIRNFPSLIQFVKSFLGMKNATVINKKLVTESIKVDWAAGSFLAFKVSHYGKLEGFDEGYFMYCEDIDICYRSNMLGQPLIFYPQIKMLHLAQHANRAFFSKHFYWHVVSVVRFLLSKYNLTKTKSSIN